MGRNDGRRGAALGLLAALMLGACAPSIAPDAINDPNEAQNRATHEFNKGVDRHALRPSAMAYGKLPQPVRQGVANFAGNLDLPGEVVNGLLQGRPHHALENTFRFAVNTTVGIGGLFDPASAMGARGKSTDFGETLHVWGVREGAYVELPLLGPSTTRDTLGLIGDIALNPVSRLVPEPERYVGTVAGAASTLGDRFTYSETVDSILYDSADSYAQARLLYLQNRRFELGQTGGEDDFIDPYEDPYAE
jgi:phospholipid-binding lipoprotein MlaA